MRRNGGQIDTTEVVLYHPVCNWPNYCSSAKSSSTFASGCASAKDSSRPSDATLRAAGGLRWLLLSPGDYCRNCLAHRKWSDGWRWGGGGSGAGREGEGRHRSLAFMVQCSLRDLFRDQTNQWRWVLSLTVDVSIIRCGVIRWALNRDRVNWLTWHESGKQWTGIQIPII